MEEIIKKLRQSIEEKNERLVIDHNEREETLEARTVNMHKKRGAEIVRSTVNGTIVRTVHVGKDVFVDYFVENERFIKMNDAFYVEERANWRRAQFREGELLSDEKHVPSIKSVNERFMEERDERVREYNRYEAVRYAERWWNDYNPVYRRFTNNCTNFISQCLRAGGAPMTGYPDRGKGWWYQGNNWSYSWAVAHSFRWYLSGAKTGLRGEERPSAKDLEIGDVICYDFDGDGRWQHTTIVVAFDINGEPLVNAQTYNSRMRYWKYEDSTAWTPAIQYKFFHILI